jgi:hypothetical protein
MERGAPRRRFECRGDEIADVDSGTPLTVADLIEVGRDGGRFGAVDRAAAVAAATGGRRRLHRELCPLRGRRDAERRENSGL